MRRMKASSGVAAAGTASGIGMASLAADTAARAVDAEVRVEPPGRGVTCV
jgi:hypothetical protein